MQHYTSTKARARATRESQHNGTQLQQRTLLAADYLLISPPLHKRLGRTRCSTCIGRAGKLSWCSATEVFGWAGTSKKHDPDAARAWLQGKLLVALLIDALRVASEAFSPWGYVPLTGSSTPALASSGQMEKQKERACAPPVSVAGVRAGA